MLSLINPLVNPRRNADSAKQALNHVKDPIKYQHIANGGSFGKFGFSCKDKIKPVQKDWQHLDFTEHRNPGRNP